MKALELSLSSSGSGKTSKQRKTNKHHSAAYAMSELYTNSYLMKCITTKNYEVVP